jgi:hypothetical protein
MKINLKSLVLGILIGGLFIGTFPTVRAATQQAINVTYNNIKISVRDQIIPTDTEPFTYNNRTFVPARVIAEALGMDVKYNELTDTVEITDKVTSNLSTLQSTITAETKVTPDGITATKYNEDYYIPLYKFKNHWDDLTRGYSERKETYSKYSLQPIPIENQEKYEFATLTKWTYVYTVKTVKIGTIEKSQTILSDYKTEILLENIPLSTIGGGEYIQYNYYVNTILPIAI